MRLNVASNGKRHTDHEKMMEPVIEAEFGVIQGNMIEMEGRAELDCEPVGVVFGEPMEIRHGVIDIGSGCVDNGSIMDRMNRIVGIIPFRPRYKLIETSEQP